jgi:CO dehydrogenase/acetyl-CoA synthase epsilon subunit
MALEYWLYGDIPPGPIKASVLTDIKTLPDIFKRFKNRLFAIGSQITKLSELTSPDLIDRVVSIALSLGAWISTSSPTIVKALDVRGVKSYDITFPLELAQKISKRSAELVILIGYPYAYEWLILNYLKHYTPNVKTLTLEPYAQPNATWTLASPPLSVWYKNMCSLEEMLKKGVQT